MKKKEAFDKIKEYSRTELDRFKFNISSDEVHFSSSSEVANGLIRLRCQSFGNIYLMTSAGQTISIIKIEDTFKNLLHHSLIDKNDVETICSIPNNAEIISEIHNFRFTELNALDDYLPKLKRYLEQVEQEFLIPFSDVNNIGKYIAQYPYEDHLKVLVGGQFPIPIMKKIFILKVGNQKDVCEEYNKGLKKTIDTYGLRYPEKADKVPILQESYAYFIERLGAIGL